MFTEYQVPVTLHTSRKSTLGYLFLFVGFAVIGLLMIRDKPSFGYLCTAFSGVGILVFAVMLHPGSSYLHLTESGFTVCTLFRKHAFRWEDVAGFLVVQIARHNLVGWYFTRNYPGRPTGRAVSAAISGAEGSFPDNYGKKPEDLAFLLNTLRHRYAG
jgi:hypothetical protein